MKNSLFILLIFVCFIACLSTRKKQKPTIAFDSKVLTGSLFTGGIEGPCTDKNNDLYLVNFHHEGSIGLIKNKDSLPQLFVNLPNGSIGNGIRFNNKNEMFVADYMNHNILKINISTKNISVYTHDTLMNQPNDLTMMKNGIIFCSDPNWKNGNGKLWRIDTNGKTHLLADSMGTTNGIEVNPTNNILYVNESVQKIIWKFNIDSAGNISNKTTLISFTDGGMDGMRCHSNGTLYLARYDKSCILAISPDGKIIKEYKLHGQKPTNIAFSRDEKKLFVTMQDKKWVEVIEF